MPYRSNRDLPPAVKGNLPAHAQAIFRNAFNSFQEQNPDVAEERAFRVAWAAVERTYKQVNGKWVAKDAREIKMQNDAEGRVSVNGSAASNARRLISAGKVVDRPWAFSSGDGNRLLGENGDDWAEYARWHLGVDQGAEDETKARYKYPFGKNGQVYLSALRAIRSRASQQGATAVFEAAGRLLAAAGDGDEEGGEAGDAAVTDSVDVTETISLDAANIRYTADGFMVAAPRVARTGIQIYAGREIGRPDLESVRVYRPPTEVFSNDSLHSYAHRPVTNDHPPESVNASNWKKYAVGQTGDQVARDGEFIRVPMVVMDEAAIADFKSGKAQLSLGYKTDLKWESGEAPDGEAYDAVQTNIRANHLAIVAAARGGEHLKIGDDLDGENNMNLKTLTVDGVQCQVTDVAYAIISRHLGQIDEQIAKLEDEGKKKDDAIKAQDDQLKAKDAEIVTLKKQAEDAKVTPAMLDAMVKDRAVVIGKASAVLGDKLVTDGKSVAEIQAQVVTAKLGDAAKGWTAGEIAASFNTLTADIKVEQQQNGTVYDAMKSFAHPHNNQDVRDKAYTAYTDDLQNAWKGKSAAA